MTPLECAIACHNAVSRVGGSFIVSPAVSTTADRLGLSFLELYIAGRAGFMGPVSHEAVAEQLWITEPGMIEKQWNGAIAVADPITIATEYAKSARTSGRLRFTDTEAVEQIVAVAEKIVAGLDTSSLPLVAGWQRHELPADPTERLAQLLQTMREYRGALHAHAIRAAGMAPVAAIVSGPDGADRARLLGWPEPYPAPDSYLAARADIEDATNELAAAQFETLTPEERTQFVSGTRVLLAGLS